MRSLVLVVALAGCHKLFDLEPVVPSTTDAPPGPNGWLDAYTYRKPITIHAGVTLADFPVSVTTLADSELAAHAMGTDILFADGNGTTPLPFELVAYSAGTLDAWVRVPNIVAPSTTIYMYYGGPVAAPAGEMWSTDYGGVWHMSSTGLLERDSARGHDLTTSGLASPTATPGKVGSARAYDGIDDEMCGDSAGSLNQGLGSFIYSAWVFVTSSATQYDQPLFKGGNTAGSPGYAFELGTIEWSASIADETTTRQVILAAESEALGRWVHLMAIVDRDANELQGYFDGGIVATRQLSPFQSVDSNTNVCIGSNVFRFKGAIDEVRLYTKALERTRLVAEYANVADRDNFITVEAEQTQ